ncbi:hypothetical protein CGLO_10576 [Colletotrichum gloeosporioides Cg-14]|uniref:Uncharacterized protein n=1 Tax=Colletotrichum gloeosporioides (strain Cg-14) TaxID=1237896 RepID=T0KD81_COLGC|nr:hypothetical protein CGLO_10576 [Colletotrichum gloeosporioides Cg-14]
MEPARLNVNGIPCQLF